MMRQDDYRRDIPCFIVRSFFEKLPIIRQLLTPEITRRPAALFVPSDLWRLPVFIIIRSCSVTAPTRCRHGRMGVTVYSDVSLWNAGLAAEVIIVTMLSETASICRDVVPPKMPSLALEDVPKIDSPIF